MTWIVGTPTRFGYAAAISDIRVTVGDDHLDCLQKIYPVGKHLALGFAGSVQIGFEMVEVLRSKLTCSKDTAACRPQAVAKWWPEFAREVFAAASPEDQDNHCQ